MLPLPRLHLNPLPPVPPLDLNLRPLRMPQKHWLSVKQSRTRPCAKAIQGDFFGV